MSSSKRERQDVTNEDVRRTKLRKTEHGSDRQSSVNGNMSHGNKPSDALRALDKLVSNPLALEILGISELNSIRELRARAASGAYDVGPAKVATGTEMPLYPALDASDVGHLSSPFPSIPEVKSGLYSSAPFIHTSVIRVDSVSGKAYTNNGIPIESTQGAELNYERLEFLGDAYIELMASSLIFSRYPHLTAGRQSQLRETLVNNTTLMRFSLHYGFDRKLEEHGLDLAQFNTTKHPTKGNKGLNKILADCFEAYIAALVLSDPDNGYTTAQRWLWTLWNPLLIQETGEGDLSRLQHWKHQWNLLAPDVGSATTAHSIQHKPPPRSSQRPSKTPSTTVSQDDPTSLLATMRQNQSSTNPYNPNAKALLQKRIAPGHIRLMYRDYKAPVKLKKTQIFYQEVALTGWGYENLVLGKGEGESKGEAGNRAATDAMRRNESVVRECEEKLEVERERRRKEKEEAEGGS
ncbi:hypothetical protein KVT40_008840 [Elsinoe batatas]|uniref:RNase III domain-containing protein n=1 Tax=Elsinoe batatas TaxID=2601811 RepID=A0A8K0PFS9_9PEZI|nr:hypothetical protein KVT40_008840 [Elsinoe batatas]